MTSSNKQQTKTKISRAPSLCYIPVIHHPFLSLQRLLSLQAHRLVTMPIFSREAAEGINREIVQELEEKELSLLSSDDMMMSSLFLIRLCKKYTAQRNLSYSLDTDLDNASDGESMLSRTSPGRKKGQQRKPSWTRDSRSMVSVFLQAAGSSNSSLFIIMISATHH